MAENILSWNSQGFYDGDIQDLANRHQPVAFTVSEHAQSNKRGLDVISGYRLADARAAEPGRGRGVAVYVREDVPFVKRPDLNRHARDREFEIANVELPTKNMIVTSHYRSPNTSKEMYTEKLDRFTKSVARRSPHSNHVIAGDINIDSLRNNRTERVMEERGYRFNVHSPTHDHGRGLDNFISNFEPAKTRVLTTSKSDHRPIKMTLGRSAGSRGRKQK